VQKNPLVIPILEILKQADNELGEYDIIQQLQQQGFEFPVHEDSYEITMFRKHFMTMNALYQLQQELYEDGYHLSITALRVSLQPLQENTGSRQLADEAEARLRDYYLDWSQFDNTSQQDVENLLKGFWKKYYALDKQAEALKTLELEQNCHWQEVQARYRQLASRHHPDKGGDHARFIEIREAFEVLRGCYR
jgi:hypothetical protein